MGRNFSRLFSAELEGIEAKRIEVETDVNVGLSSFTIVGLADKALNESKERVNAALKNIGVKSPKRENKRIIINLAPGDVKKTGTQYDVAIALGYLLATEQVRPFETKDKLFIGELSLEGGLRGVHGTLNFSRLAQSLGIQEVFVPLENAAEAALIPGITVIPVPNLRALIAHLEGREQLSPQSPTQLDASSSYAVSIDDVRGQQNAKRALLIAAAGGHNLLMVGPPGTGKTMLAQALASLLPHPSLEEVIEITQIYSAAGMLKGVPYIALRPFRAPHHSASPVAIVGGGQNPRPGEISLAHRGVLFLDEIPEFRRDLLEALRQPLESGIAHVSRAKGHLQFPASFILVAAMNPCPCGYFGDQEKACTCTAHEINRYQKKMSGPLLDRIDLQITVPRIPVTALREIPLEQTARAWREQIGRARMLQQDRAKHSRGKGQRAYTNAELSGKEIEATAHLDSDAEDFINSVFDRSLISARGYYRILKTARTIADLAGSKPILAPHLMEAFSYRVREQQLDS